MSMTLTARTAPLMFALMLGSAQIGLAQDTTAPVAPAPETAAPAAPAPEAGAPAAPGLSMGAEAATGEDAIGATYTKAEFGDWDQRCVRTETGADPCQLYQLLNDNQGSPVAEISMFALPDGQTAAAGATIIAPLETLLTAQLMLQVDANKAKVYPFTWCSTIGCVARVGFTPEEVAAFKAGNAATVTIVPVIAPDDQVIVNVSLSGFTAGYDAVAASNAAIDAAE